MSSRAPDQRDLRALAGDLVLATFAYLVVTVAYLGWFTADFSRQVFDWGDDGIYRYRVVGKELVRVVEGVVGNPLGDRLAEVPHGEVFAGEMFTAVFLVNLACFVAAIAVLSLGIESLGFDRNRRTMVVFGAVCFISLSGFAVNHYDHLSTLLIFLILFMCHRGRPNLWIALPVFVLAMLTRESALLIVPAFWVLSRHDVEFPGEWRRLTFVFGALGVATYGVLRLAMGGTPQLVQGFAIDNNLDSPVRTGGLILMALAYGTWVHIRRVVLPPNGLYRKVRREYWQLSIVYLAVCFVGASWFEIRLLIPLILIEVWLWLEITAHNPCRADIGVGTSSPAVGAAP